MLKTSVAAALLVGLPGVSIQQQLTVSETAITSLFTLAILLLCLAVNLQR